jgi:glycosyltransferase involved in cell wall biosynthesis
VNLTVITVNFNNAGGLEKTLNSFGSNDSRIKGAEWIVVDGGSKDNSLEVIQKHSAKITKWISEPDKGIYDAMNKGIDLATGRYIVFMNSGDCFYNTEFLLNVSPAWSEDIVYGDYISSDGIGEKVFKIQTEKLDFLYLLGRTINHQSVFIRRELVQKYRFDTKYSIVADWIMLFNILKFENALVRYLKVPICIYDVTGISSINNEERKLQRAQFLSTIYSDWELSQLMVLAGMRRKKWFLWFYNSFQRELINFWMRCSSQIFKAYGK